MPDLYGNQADGTWTWTVTGWSATTRAARFQVTAAGELTRIGYYRGDATTASWSWLGVYGAAGALLWQTASPADTGTVGWQWTPIDPPLAVEPGVDYTAAGYVVGTKGVARSLTPAARAAAPAPFVFDATTAWYSTAGAPAYPTSALPSEFYALSVTWAEAEEPEPPDPEGPTTTVRTTTLEVYVHDGVDWRFDRTAYAVSCSFGFDQRVAEATVRRTGGGEVAVNYWSPIEIRMGTAPGHGVAVRFNGYVIPVDNTLFPIESVLVCKGNLYRAQWVRNQAEGGTVLADPDTGTPDEDQVQAVLTECGVDFTAANIGGTGKALGSVYSGNPEDVFTPGPWAWAEGEPGLSAIERLDEVSVPDTADGRYRTFETLGGQVFRIPLATSPETTPDFSFEEGVDVLEARITRDPAGAANRVTVTGAPLPFDPGVPGVVAAETFTASTAFAPYLPPGIPNGPEGFPSVAMSFASPLIEKSENADPGDVVSCEAVAQFLLAEYNCTLDVLEFSTPRDDLLGPGQTIHLHSPRLGITDEDQHYWLQRLEITLDERGAFTQRLTCVRKS